MAEVLSLIGVIHVHGKRIRKKKLGGPAKLRYRREHSAPAVDAFFTWRAKQRRRLDLPTNLFAKALAHACEREAGLRVFLTIRTCRWTRTTWGADYGLIQTGGATGCLCGPIRGLGEWA